MAIQQFYISWREFVANRNWRTHPDDFVKIIYPAFTFESKSWRGSGNDTRHIAVLSYDDTVVSADDYDGMMAHGALFNFKELTVNETEDILNSWYPPADGDDNYFYRDSPQDFDIVDNRPVDEDLI